MSETTFKSDIKRFNFKVQGRPWFWVFTFWDKKWKNYGRFEEVLSDSPEYQNAQFEQYSYFDSRVFIARERK